MTRLVILPSVSTIVVVIDLVLRRRIFRRDDRRAFYIAIAIGAMILYIASTGYLPNVYRLGFLPLPIALAALIGIAIAEWSMPLALWVFGGFLACDLHLLPSRNLIDYFIDPVTALIAGVWCVVHLLRRRRRVAPRPT